MEQRIVQHRHCTQCGKAIPPAHEMCSDKCKKEWEAMLKKRRWNLYIFYMMAVVVIIILLLTMVL